MNPDAEIIHQSARPSPPETTATFCPKERCSIVGTVKYRPMTRIAMVANIQPTASHGSCRRLDMDRVSVRATSDSIHQATLMIASSRRSYFPHLEKSHTHAK